MNQLQLFTKMYRGFLCVLVLLVSGIGCGEYEVIHANAPVAEFGNPDLQFGKSDKSTNTKLGDRLEAGTAASGEVMGFVALPVTLAENEVLEMQTWTERPAVVMVYGPRATAEWDFQRVRAATRDIKPGVHSEYVQYAAPASGEYLVVVGNGDTKPNRWILARAGHMDVE